MMHPPGRRTPDDAPRFIAHLAPAIQWLRDHGVPATKIAGALRLTPERIRQIDRRRQSESSDSWTPPDLTRPLSASARQLLGIRARPDRSEASRYQGRRAAELRDEIAAIRQRCANAYQFIDGIATLRAALRKIGYPSHTEMLRAAAAA